MNTDKLTIVEVAKKAGVSIATVSRVMNNNPNVKQATRKKVQKVIDEMNYIPAAGAQEMGAKRSMNIGVILPSVYNMFFAEVLDGIEDYLQQDSYFLLLSCAKNNAEREMNCVRSMISRKVSGIIILSPNTQNINTEFYREVVQYTPLVFVNSHCHIPGASYVNTDEKLGTHEAIEYLFSLGHKKILFVRGINSDSYEIKEEAFCEIMRRENLDAKNYIVNIGEGNSTETAEHTMEKLLEVLPQTDATAVFCCNDLMAAGTIEACNRLEKLIPGDISVMGYDNTSVAKYITPKLTSVDQNMFELGRNAAQMLIEKISTGQAKRITLYNSIVERDSTGAVRNSIE